MNTNQNCPSLATAAALQFAFAVAVRPVTGLVLPTQLLAAIRAGK